MRTTQENERYFIVLRDALSEYGNEVGSTKEEAVKLLNEAQSEMGNLVVIRGVLIKPTFNLDN